MVFSYLYPSGYWLKIIFVFEMQPGVLENNVPFPSTISLVRSLPAFHPVMEKFGFDGGPRQFYKNKETGKLCQVVLPIYRLVIGRRQSLPKAREVILTPGGL
jgi:hypothetical protein